MDAMGYSVPSPSYHPGPISPPSSFVDFEAVARPSAALHLGGEANERTFPGKKTRKGNMEENMVKQRNQVTK